MAKTTVAGEETPIAEVGYSLGDKPAELGRSSAHLRPAFGEGDCPRNPARTIRFAGLLPDRAIVSTPSKEWG